MSIKLKNMLTFIACIIETRTPPSLWIRGWREAKAAHRQWIHKQIWELKKEGKIHEDENGLLWSAEVKEN